MTEFANYLMEHVVRIELTSSDWKSDIITIILYMHILAGAKGIEPLSVVLETTIIAVILYSYIWRRGWDLNPRNRSVNSRLLYQLS